MKMGEDGKHHYFEQTLKFQIVTTEITLSRKSLKTAWGLNVSDIRAKLYDGLELYIAKVQSMDEKGLAKKCGLKERDQILQVNDVTVREMTTDQFTKLFQEHLTVKLVLIGVDDRDITNLFLMATREQDLFYLWALRKLVKLSICNIELSETGLDLSAITTNLFELAITNCSLNSINQIQGLARLRSLRRLTLTHNNLTELDPKIMLKLTEVTDLQLGYNMLKTFPAALTKMEKLEELSLIYNQITNVPDEVCQMRSLEKLHLDNNVLTELPRSVALQLPQLRALTLENNQLAETPQGSVEGGNKGASEASRSKFYYKIGVQVTDNSIMQ